MWIPKHLQPSSLGEKQAVIVQVETYGTGLLLHQLYMDIFKFYEGRVPSRIEVSTDKLLGGGYRITPVQAYCAYKEQLLGDEVCADNQRTDGVTDYVRYTYTRLLDMNKLHNFLGDRSLPPPLISND